MFLSKIVIEEVLVANSVCLLVIIVSMLSRIEIKKEKHLSGKFFESIVGLTFFALIAETVTFLLDAKPGIIAHILQYLTNAYLFLASSCIGILWVLFVDSRIFHSIIRIKKWLIVLLIPYLYLLQFLL